MNRIEAAFQKLTNSSDMFQRMRSQAFDELTQLPLPSKKEETWKYTSPRPFLDAAWDSASASTAKIDLSQLPFAKTPSAAALVFVDGRLQKNLSKGTLNATALSQNFISRFGGGEFFEKMNLALLNEGIHLELEAKEYAAPIILLFISTKSADQFAANYRVTLRAPTNCKATVVEAYFGEAAGASQTVVQTVIEKNASLNHIKIQSAPQAQNLTSTQFQLCRDSRLESTTITLGGALVRNNLSVLFSEEGAEAIVNGLYLGSGSEHIDNRTLIDHAVGNTTSTQLYKGVLDDTAHGVFTGGVRIRKDAQKANSSQLNNNLMLSQKAEIDTKPELEIDADDVKAAHGATIGQINPDHIFYLQSRALSRQQAVEMLASGFAQDIVDRVSDKVVRSELATLVKHKFSSFRVELL